MKTSNVDFITIGVSVTVNCFKTFSKSKIVILFSIFPGLIFVNTDVQRKHRLLLKDDSVFSK